MPTIAQNASLRDSSEYKTAETKAREKAIAAGKQLKQSTLPRNAKQRMEITSKDKVQKGADQLATNLRSFHKI